MGPKGRIYSIYQSSSVVSGATLQFWTSTAVFGTTFDIRIFIIVLAMTLNYRILLGRPKYHETHITFDASAVTTNCFKMTRTWRYDPIEGYINFMLTVGYRRLGGLTTAARKVHINPRHRLGALLGAKLCHTDWDLSLEDEPEAEVGVI